MEEFKEHDAETNGMQTDPIEFVEFDNTLVTDSIDSNTSVTYGETVLASVDSILRLPDNILEIWADYEQGLLPKVQPGEVQELLNQWFQNTLAPLSKEEIDECYGNLCECTTDSGPNDYGQLASELQKRRRVDCNV